MGFLDKAKATATQAMQQGQAKVGAIQQSRAESELYRALGEAAYREQRQGGDHAAVEAGVAALDAHFAQVAEAAAAAAAASASTATGGTASGGFSPGGGVPGGGASGGGASGGGAPASGQMGSPAPAPTTQHPAPPSGNFTLDDM